MAEIIAPALAGTTEIAPLTNPVFISDLHLAPEHPNTLMQFFRFMKTQVPYYDELVILGDLFDYWIGDDTIETAAPIVKALAYAASTGKRILIAQGNRDVMLGADFASACGATLLAPEVTVECMGKTFLLSHGDEWCTKDIVPEVPRDDARPPVAARRPVASGCKASRARPPGALALRDRQGREERRDDGRGRRRRLQGREGRGR